MFIICVCVCVCLLRNGNFEQIYHQEPWNNKNDDTMWNYFDAVLFIQVQLFIVYYVGEYSFAQMDKHNYW